MSDSSNDRAIRDWLVRLAAVCRPQPGMEQVAQRLSEYIPFLRDMPAGAFNSASREALARESEFFPTYAELRTRLEGWWSANRPRPRALPGPAAHAALDLMAQRWVAFWFKRIGDSDCLRDGQRAGLLHLIRDKAPDAYRYLLASDATAAEVAVRRKLPPGDVAASVAADWQDAAAVRESVAKILAPLADGSDPPAGNIALCLTLLRGLVKLHAPENLWLVPGQPAAPDEAPAAGPQPWAPRPVAPEVLQALRDASPAVQRARAMRAELRRAAEAAVENPHESNQPRAPPQAPPERPVAGAAAADSGERLARLLADDPDLPADDDPDPETPDAHDD